MASSLSNRVKASAVDPANPTTTSLPPGESRRTLPKQVFQAGSRLRGEGAHEELGEGGRDIARAGHTALSGDERREDSLPADLLLNHEVVQGERLRGQRQVIAIGTAAVGGLDDVGEAQAIDYGLADDALHEAAAVLVDGLRAEDGCGNVWQRQLTDIGV